MKEKFMYMIFVIIILVLFGIFVWYVQLKKDSDVSTPEKNNTNTSVQTGVQDTVKNSQKTGEKKQNKEDISYYTYEDYLEIEYFQEINPVRIKLSDKKEKKRFINVLRNFYDFRHYPDDYIGTSEVEYEYNIIEAFATDDCNKILEYDSEDKYTYDLCKIYTEKNIDKLNEMYDELEEGDFNLIYSLIVDKPLRGLDDRKRTYEAIKKFDYYKDNIEFDLNRSHDKKIQEYFVYLKHNDEERYYKKLEDAFTKEYKKFFDK